MPEFEETKPNPNLHKGSHQYQPSKGKPTHESSKDLASPTPSSNMRSRWKRSSRGGAPKTALKNEIHPNRQPKEISHPQEIEEAFSAEDYEIEEYKNERDFDHEHDQEPIHEKEEHTSRTHTPKKPKEEKPFKVTSRKDVFIPKTKQDSERYRSRSSTSSKKSIWKKILAFLGLAAPVKRKSSESRSHHKHSDSRGHGRSSSHTRRPYQQRRPGGQQKHRSGPSHKQDQKSND